MKTNAVTVEDAHELTLVHIFDPTNTYERLPPTHNIQSQLHENLDRELSALAFRLDCVKARGTVSLSDFLSDLVDGHYIFLNERNLIGPFR